jgi:two-component system alkaline phosphatase synthesis response regulator PhoP
MARLLLISDDIHGASLKSDLEFIGHIVHQVVVEDKSAMPDLLRQGFALDLVLIDPGSSPDRLLSLVQGMRNLPQYSTLPIVTVVEESDAIQLDFSAGIQDFIAKPCSLRQIEARIRLVLWDTDRPENDQFLKIGHLVINLERYEVRVNGSIIDLTLKEYELLKHLVTHKGRVFTRSDLLDNIWGYDYYGGMRTVDVHIRRLRSKLEDMGEAITTVRGVGYCFKWS